MVKASWPQADEVDYKLLQSGVYLMEAAHSFRLQQKNLLNIAKKNQVKAKVVEKPTKAIAWVAKTFPPWQTTILETMKQLYSVCVNYIFLRDSEKEPFTRVLFFFFITKIIANGPLLRNLL